MPYKNILVAIDHTDEADDVLTAALETAKLNNAAELSIVSVIRPLQHSLGGLDAGAVGVTASLYQQIHQETKEHVNKRARMANVAERRIYIKEGNPAAEIRQTAEEIAADLIVIGTHGRHGLGLLLGSTANGVLHGVQCDVLTIRIK